VLVAVPGVASAVGLVTPFVTAASGPGLAAGAWPDEFVTAHAVPAVATATATTAAATARDPLERGWREIKEGTPGMDLTEVRLTLLR
jgi:hypothetical protein